METLLKVFGSLASPADLPVAEQIAASAVLLFNVACIVVLRRLTRRELPAAAERVDYDQAA